MIVCRARRVLLYRMAHDDEPHAYHVCVHAVCCVLCARAAGLSPSSTTPQSESSAFLSTEPAWAVSGMIASGGLNPSRAREARRP